MPAALPEPRHVNPSPGLATSPPQRQGEASDPSRPTAAGNRPYRDAWLALRVHLDAAISAPAEYLGAAWWWLRGKRLRARSRLAPLLGSSPHAYQLWLRREERSNAPPDRSSVVPTRALPIVAIVEVANAGAPDLDATLRSLDAQGVSAVVLGNKEVGEMPRVPSLEAAGALIDWSENPWLMPIMAGDLLAQDAAQAYREAVAGSGARLAYADDDLVAGTDLRNTPHFKPDWNSELFEHFDYLSGACVLKASQADFARVSGTTDWVRRLVTQACREGTPLHVRKVLHHRRARRQPCIPGPLPAAPATSMPPVTVIVPTRNRVDLLRACLGGLDATNYREFEVIVIDNGSDDPQTLAFLDGLDRQRYKVLSQDGAFNFAALNNRAVEEARGRVLCLLNNDIEMLGLDWLSPMVRQAMRDDVGAVGAQLRYPDGRIQHAGVVLGVGGAAAHSHRLLSPDDEGYFRRHQLPQFVSAVTAACLVVQRDRFLAVGGFDERSFPVAFNDVDLCLRLNQRGWHSLYEPRAVLIHHESVSRGHDRQAAAARRFASELSELRRIWGTDTMLDPYHHPQLSRYSERFVIVT